MEVSAEDYRINGRKVKISEQARFKEVVPSTGISLIALAV